ncbi:unnamed protein product [Plutella xylostella]|uniref:(diamondback moth) hypothetical protein n=1 Tax=Plutella xylostella TaxID=51655 RepID=A0A8S4G1I6_PLUXY|nr:unnamed protein product [Plutella xylostella]
MVSKALVVFCIQAVAFQAVYSQYIPQVLTNQCGQQILPSPTVIPSPQTTVIQDSSVSNNLANALQLLVVSSLLNNALPFNQQEVLVPTCGGSYITEQVIPQVVPQVVNGYYPQIAQLGQLGQLGQQIVAPSVLGPVYGQSLVGPSVINPGCGCGLGGVQYYV